MKISFGKELRYRGETPAWIVLKYFEWARVLVDDKYMIAYDTEDTCRTVLYMRDTNKIYINS